MRRFVVLSLVVTVFTLMGLAQGLRDGGVLKAGEGEVAAGAIIKASPN